MYMHVSDYLFVQRILMRKPRDKYALVARARGMHRRHVGRLFSTSPSWLRTSCLRLPGTSRHWASSILITWATVYPGVVHGHEMLTHLWPQIVAWRTLKIKQLMSKTSRNTMQMPGHAMT
eukprot:scaffold199157_cov20-Prasinocladus_malaysianus.AAC.1